MELDEVQRAMRAYALVVQAARVFAMPEAPYFRQKLKRLCLRCCELSHSTVLMPGDRKLRAEAMELYRLATDLGDVEQTIAGYKAMREAFTEYLSAYGDPDDDARRLA
jgi:hypothetical protein